MGPLCLLFEQHPVFSICFTNPFSGQTLSNISSGLDEETYSKYLRGHISGNEKYFTISYDKVTINLYKFVKNIRLGFNINGIQTIKNCQHLDDCKFLRLKNNYNGIFDSYAIWKCFGFEIDRTYSEGLLFIKIFFKKEIKNYVTPSKWAFGILHHLNQLFRKTISIRLQRIWKYNNTASHFNIDSYEILKRRYKREEQCLPSSMAFDEFVIKRQIEKIGCRAPYHLTFNQFPFCQTKENLKQFEYIRSNLSDDSFPPCDEMTTIYYHRDEDVKRLFFVEVWYANDVKVVRQLKAIDAHTLIGYIGGYIGLFLGMMNRIIIILSKVLKQDFHFF